MDVFADFGWTLFWLVLAFAGIWLFGIRKDKNDE